MRLTCGKTQLRSERAMWRYLFITISTLALWSQPAQAQVVYEQVNDVVIVEVEIEDRLSRQVVFYRDGRFTGKRVLFEDVSSYCFMQWQLLSDGRFRLSWTDYCCERVVEFDRLHVMRFDSDPLSDNRLWWGDQRRLMGDLQQP